LIEEGTIIEGPFWPEPVEIKKIEQLGTHIHLVGATINTNDHVDQVLTEEECKKIKTKEYALTFSGSAHEAFLAVEAERYKFASLFDPLLAMNTSKIDPLPFQIEAVYGYILKLPRIRFLIADDPGAGKTIMAGLIIKELKLRGIINRFLIVTPGHLKDQWRRELKDKFQEPVIVIERGFMSAHYAENPWQRENQVITSIDFAKREDILPSLGSVEWDLIIVDEAHKMAAYRYGNALKKTERYKLGEVLSENSTHLLFLTATPHKGDPENYRLFLDLLVPGFFATDTLINESLQNEDNPLFIRRMKEDLKDFEGKPIFTNRYPKTIRFRLSDKEKILYNEVSKYVISQYNLALQKDNRRNVAFALLILQRRMASSTYALLRSLERRKKRLDELIERAEFEEESLSPIDFDEIEDYEEEKRWKQETKWETLSIAENKTELMREITTLKILIEKAKEIVAEGNEIKLSELKEAIEEGFKKIREMQGKEKILIFTESKDTLQYLVKRIESWGYTVNYIHGGMRLEERVEAEKIFQHQTQIMVATEAAGEGINLQFCHLMINYDIPWNPNRLEQRMGRVHRYGQQKDVYIFNLVAQDTREGKVLSKLLDKLEEIRRAVGTDKVFDIIGDTFYGRNLYQLMLEAVATARTMDEIIAELDIIVDEKYIAHVKEALGESLATKHIDYTRIKEMAEKSKEHRLIPEYVEEFFKKAFQEAGGKYRIRKDTFMAIDSIPYTIRKISDEIHMKNRYGSLLRSYPKASFEKDVAFKNPDVEFLCFGHPLFEGVLEWVERHYFSVLRKGAVFEDPTARYDGIIWLFEGEVKDGKGNIAGKRLMALYEGEEMREINPAILWDFVPSENKKSDVNPKSVGKAQTFAIDAVEKYKHIILEERKRQAEIKKKYGIKSLEYLIGELDTDLAKLYERQMAGEKVDIVIRNKKERKTQYEESLHELKTEIEQEMSLTISMPKFIGAVLVRPLSSEDMVSDKEIETVGMEVAMAYERTQGRDPEDISHENLGFDIRSKGKEEIRYIEVKARKNIGDVALTLNEWFKAKRFKEQYWLYVVAHAATNPALYVICNPAENLDVTEKVEVVRFFVPVNEWQQKGVKV